MLAGMPSVMTEMVESLRRSGSVLDLELGAAEERDVVDVAAAVAGMLEHNPHGYQWLLLLTVAFNDVCALPPITCWHCAAGTVHLRHEYVGCSCKRHVDLGHSIDCDLYGRRRVCDDALLHGE